MVFAWSTRSTSSWATSTCLSSGLSQSSAVAELQSTWPRGTHGQIGTPCADSCGIFCLGKLGEYQLKVGLPAIHEHDKMGFLWVPSLFGRSLSSAVAGDDEEGVQSGPYHVHEASGGPGQSMAVYLPKKAEFVEKLTPTLSPSKESAVVTALAAKTEGKGKGTSGNRVLKMQEKRLDVNLWRLDGQIHRGSHFPVVCFTKNACRRSPDANERRRKKQLEAKSGRTPWTYEGT